MHRYPKRAVSRNIHPDLFDWAGNVSWSGQTGRPAASPNDTAFSIHQAITITALAGLGEGITTR